MKKMLKFMQNIHPRSFLNLTIFRKLPPRFTIHPSVYPFINSKYYHQDQVQPLPTQQHKLRAHSSSSYQFRVERPYYYPNRADERQRAGSHQTAATTTALATTGTAISSKVGMPTKQHHHYRRDLVRESYQRQLTTSAIPLRKHSTLEQIKSTYYNLAKMFHNRDVERSTYEMQRFKELSNAYKILIEGNVNDISQQQPLAADFEIDKDREQTFLRQVDDLTRALTTTKRATTMKKSNSAGFVYGSGGGVGGGIVTSGVNSFAKGSGVPSADMHASTLTTEELLKIANTEPKIELTFEEAAQGIKRNYALRFVKKCPSCHGKSPLLANRSNPEICRKCCGTGTITKHTATYSTTDTCDRCNGSKFTKRNQCSVCDNRGLLMDNTLIELALPAGVKSGDTVTAENPITKKRVSFCIHVYDSKYFQRNGNDVYTEKYISLPDAILGCSCTVHGLHGKVSFKVPPGLDSHTKIVVRGKGIRSYDGTVGDHIVTVKVAIPKGLSTRQRQLVLALSQTEDQPIEYED